MKYRLIVYGAAQPAGSKRAFYRPKLGVRIVDANPKAKEWKERIASEAGRIANGLLIGPLFLHITFFRTRPAGHYGTGRNSGVVKKSAPSHPVTKPDTTKLLRGAEDALTGILYRDDAQICQQIVSKEWGDPARVEIGVEEIEA